MNWLWQLDGWIVLAGSLCALACSLLGNFLVLRRMSLLGDAISHAVLPGLVAAFLISGSRTSWVMFLGAVIVGILTAVLTEWVRSYGRVDEGASLGVVFTTLFALGLVMIKQAADHIDLDASCVLYGAIETAYSDKRLIFGLAIPRVVITLGGVATLNLLFVALFYKELKLSSFDPVLSTISGFSSRWMHYALMTLTAVTAVASFESVGNILVVAMFVVPAAAAYLLTDRLWLMIMLSALIGVASAVLGHISASVVPRWFGLQVGTTTAGMMAVVAGLLFCAAALFAPNQGIVVKLVRRWFLGWQILSEDVLGLLYRLEERDQPQGISRREIRSALLSRKLPTRAVLGWQTSLGRLSRDTDGYRLTDDGRRCAREVVRSHRLWEQYLVDHAGVSSARIHDKAERLEHFTDRQLRDRLAEEMASPTIDPHGSPIPVEEINLTKDSDVSQSS